jgi:cytoskeletal protein CcmA (bactofilin family)
VSENQFSVSSYGVSITGANTIIAIHNSFEGDLKFAIQVKINGGTTSNYFENNVAC